MLYGEISASELSLDMRELSARLSVPIGELPSDIDGEIQALASAVNPAYSAVRAAIEITEDGIVLDGVTVGSRALAKVLAGCSEALIVTVTLGRLSERYLRGRAALSPSSHFFADAVADAMVEAAADEAEGRITDGREHTPRFSPGYADLPLSFVEEIVKRTDAARLLGVTLSESHLATPSKTVTAIIGIK